ncbi:MAG: hypothetical protein KAS16_02910 [Thermoplasmata archaeon]|nr:hypothetical protein [Thermoplasmata archaeon]
MNDFNLEDIENIVMEYSGPMGKFVVRKQVRDLRSSIDQMTEPEKRTLITNIINGAIFNENYQRECQKRLTDKLIGKIMIS